jgi:hypothetical protein
MNSNEAKTPQRKVLRRELDELCRESQRYIKAKRRRSAAIRGFEQALPFLIVVPAAWLGLRLLMGVSGGLSSVSGWWVIPATLIVPLCLVLFAMISSALARIDRRDALAAIDQELGLEDRLVTAEEFIGLDETTPFVEAALEDAARIAPTARDAVLRLDRERFAPGKREAWTIAASLILALLGTWVGEQQRSAARDGVTSSPAADEVALIDARDEDPTTRPESQTREEREQPQIVAAAPAKTKAAETRRDKAGELSDQTKESEGKTGEGRSSDAESTSGASESRGMPSNQSQKSDAGKQAKKKDKKKKAKPPVELQPTEKKNADENSGSTAGKGSSKGSNKNPAVSKWSSKDQVTTEDDQEIEEDEETEDEEEDQESRGGMQPNLRDRKPPVSRDLRIGFGNQKNPDANGRGGPSEAKKSRGTASLVLGVPIPDRVKGQPNPGKTKITQERIEPKAEESTAIQAGSRLPRQAPAGNVQERELTPWMRTLVREYFLTLRNKNRRS